MKYKFIINPKYESLTGFVNEIPQKFDREGMLIYDSRNTVRVFKQEDEKIVVKRFHRSPLHQRFDYTFVRPSKCKRAYNYALKLQELGIGDPDLRLLREEQEGHDDLIDALAHFLVTMHEKGFFHGDTNLSNFLYRKDASAPQGYCITTIDINRSLFVENPSREDCIRNLMRLTHVRPVLKKIISRYAELRGWDVEWAVSLVMQKLDNFEKKKELTKKMKKK